MKKFIFGIVLLMLSGFVTPACTAFEQERNGVKLIIHPVEGEKIIVDRSISKVTGGLLRALHTFPFRVTVVNNSKKTLEFSHESFYGIEPMSDFKTLASQFFDGWGFAALICGAAAGAGVFPFLLIPFFDLVDRNGISRESRNCLCMVGGLGLVSAACLTYVIKHGHGNFEEMFLQQTITTPIILPPKSRTSQIIFLDQKNHSVLNYQVRLAEHGNPSKIAAKFLVRA